MKLTTKGRYAVTAMLDLALHEDCGPVSLAAIAGRQELSVSYLEQLFVKLRRNGLVSSYRGPGGGYSLGKVADQVSVADIIEAVDESVDATSCSGKGNCHEGNICITHHLWDDLTQQIRCFLGGISLADLVARSEIQSIHARQSSAKGSDSGKDNDLQVLTL